MLPLGSTINLRCPSNEPSNLLNFRNGSVADRPLSTSLLS